MYIYAGKPSSRYQDKYGSSARIQLNDKFASVDEVGAFILAERASKRQELQNVLTTALKVDSDTKMGLILFHAAFQTGFCTFFLRGFIKELPHELVESARMDGASEFEIYWRIIIPLVRPALAALAVLEFTFIWNDYFWSLVLVQGEQARPVTLGIQALRGQWTASWHLVSAGSIIAALPPVIMFFLLQKHFIAGLTMGAIKE